MASSESSVVTKMLRLCLVEAISSMDDAIITSTLSSNTLKNEFLERAIHAARLRLREAGHTAITESQAWEKLRLMHKVFSIVPNAPKMLDDLRDSAPAYADRAKLELWQSKWKGEGAKAKLALE